MNNWTNIYNEIMSFYFYEPQHIGKRANPGHKYSHEKEMLQHISEIEVPLNHMFSIMLSIAPNQLTKLITKKVFGTIPADDYFLDQDDVYTVNKTMGDATQPDLVLSGKKTRVMIEMKINSKTSLDQYFKYLLFTYFMENQSGAKKNYLIYLASDTFEDMWKEKFTNAELLKDNFTSLDLPLVTKKGKIDVQVIQKYLVAISQETNIGFINYQELAEILIDEINNNKDDEILVNLYNGFVSELLKRNLVKNYK